MNKYLPTSWIDLRIEVRTSPMQGQGLFAAAPLKAGEVVMIWGGQLFTEAEIAAGKAARGSYSVIAAGLYLGTAVEEGKHPDDFMNHACDPNVWLDDAVTLVARRDMAAGEELTANYALWEADESWVARWTCQCGSPLCRRVITGQDWRLPELQVGYGQHFSPFINERIRRLRSDR